MQDDQTQQLRLLFDDRFMDKHAGGIVADPVTAIVELVANAWDAGSRNVTIHWPTADTPFSIEDDGKGMTPGQFQHRWRTLDYNRLAEQGGVVTLDDGTRRPAFGKNGRGRHASLCFANSYTVTTVRGGIRSAWQVRRGRTQPLEIVKLSQDSSPGKGTRIVADASRQVGLSPGDARTEIGLRFLADPAFRVKLDGEVIQFDHLPEVNCRRETLTIDGVGEVEIITLDTLETDRSSRQHGIAWRVASRLVGRCDWKGFGDRAFLDGRKRAAKRYTFVVLANVLGDAVLPDWSGFEAAHSVWMPVRDAVHEHIRTTILASTRVEREATANNVRQNHRSTLCQLPPSARETWHAFVDTVLEECPGLSERDVSDLAGILARLEVSNSKYNLVRRLGALDPNELDDLEGVLADWTVRLAKVVLDEVATRLALIEELQAKVSNPKTDEVGELQPLFEKGLWIFGPEFETIHFTSNVGMTKVIRSIFGDSTARGSLNRPDFVVAVDGTVGLYSYPEYDDEGGEVGIARLVVLELKKPGIPISDREKSQAWRYVKELKSKGYISDRTRVDCFVLGSKLDPAEAHVRTEAPNVRIAPMLYHTALSRAHSRTFQLYKEVKDAPFMSDDERLAWERYMNGQDQDGEPALPFAGATAPGA